MATVTVLLSFVESFATLLVPTFLAELINEGATSVSLDAMIGTCIRMLAVALIASICAITGGWLASVLSSRVARDIRDAVYKKSLDLSMFDFRSFGTASMTTRTINDVNIIQVMITNFIFMMMPVPFIFALALFLSFRLSVPLAWYLVGFIVLIIIVAAFILRSASPLYRKLQRLLDRIGTVLLENMTGVRVIRAFGKEKYENKRMNSTFRNYANTSIRANRLFANLDGLSYVAVNLFIAVVYFLAGHYISLGQFGIGDIVAIIEYAVFCLFYLMMAQMMIAMLPRALECCRRVRSVLEHEPRIQDPAAIEAVDMSQRGPLKDGEVMRFNDVTFRYDDAEENSLEHISFTCSKGKTTAIIGGTGSGKSTIAMLAMRFQEATQGSITLDGVDVRNMKQHDLRERVSLIQQRAWLFSGSLEDNLQFRDVNAEEEELRHALSVAQATGFVDELPQGLSTRVAQGGTNFSGGQRQRLSIARALIGHSQMIIFDDSFSALDFLTDAALRKALGKEMSDRAVLIIAQRVNTIQHADEIIVLNDGRIAGRGTHEELLRDCEVYREIVESQTQQHDEPKQTVAAQGGER
ncbi:ABC transporter ATP-binding protein [Bifidobacterium dolichotidis]|nr:ABC transporter ATP-binding protein [Bifidobacterium dolichotidis]